jgi:hypothetical protein
MGINPIIIGEKIMKKYARKAYDELKNKGVHVIPPENGWGGHFAISAELYGDGSKGDDFDKKLDYYASPTGDNTIIPEILEKHGLYFEWVNGGVVAVYD